MLCSKCPRAIHLECLDGGAPHAQHKKKHCPLCVKRRWNHISPTTPTQQDGQSDEDFRMERVNRYRTWHRCSCQHIYNWQKLHDDGSLASDRKLLVDMNVVRRGRTKAVPTLAAKSQVRSAEHDSSQEADTFEPASVPVASQPEERRGGLRPDEGREGTQSWSFSRIDIGEI